MSNTTLRELTAEFEAVLALALEEDDGEELAGRLAEIDMAIEDKADNYGDSRQRKNENRLLQLHDPEESAEAGA